MALAGDHVVVKFNTTAFATGDITSVDIGSMFAQHDVTGFGDVVQNFINGQMQAPVTIKGFFTTAAHAIIEPLFRLGTTVNLEVQVGLNAAPVAGNPEFAGAFLIESYKPTLDKGSAVTFTLTLKPVTGTAPAWGTV